MNDFRLSNSAAMADRGSIGAQSRSGRSAPTSARAVGSFVAKLTRKSLEKYGFSAAALLTQWPAIVGDELASHTQPQRLKWPHQVGAFAEVDAHAMGRPGATLMLGVDAARALDVQYQAAQIIERINGYFGYRAVRELKIVQLPAGASKSGRRAADDRDIVAPERSQSASEVDLSTVRDDKLRAALERLRRGVERN